MTEETKMLTQGGSDEEETNSELLKPPLKYSKRKGTSGMTGSIYKTNLLSLVLYRTLIDKSVDFVLGCDVDKIGIMSEICYRHHAGNTEKPAVVFIKTSYKHAITDKNFNTAVSDINLLKCYQSFLLIKDRFNNDETDPLFKGNFDDVEPYLVIYTPNSCNINKRLTVPVGDQIFTKKLDRIMSDGEVKNIFKIETNTSVDDIIYEEIEKIGKIIAACVVTGEGDPKHVNEEMLNVIVQYYNFLIPDVIQINEMTDHCYGKFNHALYGSSNKCHRRLKKVLFEEVLRNSTVSEADSSHNERLLQRGDIATLIANGLRINENNDPVIYKLFTFDEHRQKLVFLRCSSFDHCAVVQGLCKIKVTKAMMDEALEIAGINKLKTIKILFTSQIHESIVKLAETRNTECCFNSDRKVVEKFLKSLYIYSEQGKDSVKHIRKEVEDQVLPESGFTFKCRTELVYLQLYNKVQRWWLLQDKPYYLTNNNCDFLEQDSVIKSPYLSTLNFRCINEVEDSNFKFKTASLELIKNISDLQNRAIVNIISDNVFLSTMKLVQYFEQSDKNCLFVDFENVSHMKKIEYKMFTDELSKTNVDIFVLIMHETEYNNSVRLYEITRVFTMKIVTVSKSALPIDKTKIVKYYDFTSLIDIDNVDEVLKYEITMQGKKDKLETFIGNNMNYIHLIKAEVLYKIIKQENIEIGKNLSDSAYEIIKDYFIERKIRLDGTEMDIFSETMDLQKLNVFSDIQEPIVTIIAAPGMGKSKLLSHLCVNTKSKFPNRWIFRMNLLDYSEHFYNWHENKSLKIGLKESMELVCKAEIGNDDKFSLELIDGVLVLNNKELEGTDLLHLEVIIESFNNGYIFYIFDGFDEICPHYEREVVQFIKCFIDWNRQCERSNPFAASNDSLGNQSKRENRHRVWITSRPYNTIKHTLTENFTTPFYIQHLNKDEQTRFYHKYWEHNLKIEKLSKEQFENVNSFFENMNKYRVKSGVFPKRPSGSVVPLRIMYEAAVDYFRYKVATNKMVNVNKEELLCRWISKDEMRTLNKYYEYDNVTRIQFGHDELAGTPLHMQIYAELFVGEIINTSASKNWEMDVHTFEFHERFLETKLKKIRFEEKCGEEFYSTTSQIFYDEEKQSFIETHKLLALYALFDSTEINLLVPKKWKFIESTVKKLAEGKEKTGLIDQIHANGVPRFVHLVFAEYFAVECVADLLKTNDDEYSMKILIKFIINSFFQNYEGIMTVFELKVKRDEHLRITLTNRSVMKIIFDVLMENTRLMQFPPTLVQLLRSQSTNTVKLLLQCMEGNLNSSNMRTFMRNFDSKFFYFALKYEDIVEYVLDSAKKVDLLIYKEFIIKRCGKREQPACLDNKTVKKHLHNKLDGRSINGQWLYTFKNFD